MGLLEEVCDSGGSLCTLIYAQVFQCGTVQSLLPIDQDVEFSTTSPVPCLPACCLASFHDDNGLLNL